MPLEQLSNNLDFFSFYSGSKQAVTGLTVTVDVWKHLTSTNTSSQIVTAGSATEVGGGLYQYQLSSASVTGEGEYICIFKTTSTTPDQQHIPSIWCVQKAGSEYLDAAVTSRGSATDVVAIKGPVVAYLDVAVSTGAAPAIWNYLAASATTVSSLGKLLVDNVNATIASRMATFTYTAPDNTSVGTILARTDVATSTRASATDYTTTRAGYLDRLDATISSRQASGNVTIAGYAAGQDPATLVWAASTRTLSGFGFSVTVGTNNDKTGYALAVTPPTAQQIWDTLTSALTTAGSVGKRIADNLDATVGTRLAGSSYTAPDNTSVGTILARTDVATSTRASATDYTTARATKLDNLDVTISSRQASGNVTIAGYAAGQDPATLTGVTTTRGAKLDNLDATVSSRLAPAGLTQLQADVTAIKTPVVANIDATISSRLASASYTSTNITSLQADVTAIKVKTDANLDTTVSSRLTPAGITSLQADVTAIVNVSPANSAIYSKVADAIYYATDARDKAWLNYQVLYGVTTPAGSMSEKLNAVKATVDANLNATVSSRLAASAYAPSSGSGAIAYTVTLLQPGTAIPIAGAEVWITSNSAGTTVVAGTLLTNGSGQSTFMVDAGSYYLWVQATGWNFTNPQAFVVS